MFKLEYLNIFFLNKDVFQLEYVFHIIRLIKIEF